MKFEEILPALRDGKKITNEHIKKCGFQYIYYRDGTIFENYGGYRHLTDKEIVEIDDSWEIVNEKKKVKLRDLTEEEYKTFLDKRCGNQVDAISCVDCPFYRVSCLYDKDDKCWIDNKDLYSDKFLDQEVEIEVDDD